MLVGSLSRSHQGLKLQNLIILLTAILILDLSWNISYISRNELTREDFIDVIAETDGTTITLTAEDTISNGVVVFRIFMASNAQKNCYFKFDDGVISEYKGVVENITLRDVVIKPLARSEEFRAAWLNSYERNGNTFTIQNTNTNKISEVNYTR